ncbi:MAG: ribosome maturation factor RimP [Atopobiaceae bacterium]|nr:ribosome maturation factor RimP [Atopobiaceae bacterium]
MARDVREQVLEALEEQAPSHGADIVDVELVGSDRSPLLRVRIDHADENANPITLDEVAAHNAWIEVVLDQIDPISGSYTLEVSSPGLSRPLRRPRDFERFAGERVSLTTHATEGRRRFTGTLLGIEDGTVSLEVDNEHIALAFEDIKSCKLKPEFDSGSNSAKRSQ